MSYSGVVERSGGVMVMDALSRATLERGCFQMVCARTLIASEPRMYVFCMNCRTAQANRSLRSHKPTMLETFAVDHRLGGQECVGVALVDDVVVVATPCHRRLVLSGGKQNNGNVTKANINTK